jgi:uncharacterized oxidoreductase
MKQAGNTILVTGGGSGIGRELARRWHDGGNTVIVAGRRREALDETIAGRERMHAVMLDVDSEEGVTSFVERLLGEHPALNVLVNNAGIMRLEDIAAKRDLHDAEETITTNLLGPIRLTNALVEHLAAQPDAAIVNVTSGLAFVPLVTAATYSATKAAIHSYTASLREVLKERIEVIELAPPGVQTALTPGQETRDGYMPVDAFIGEVMDLFARNPTPAEILVDRVRPLRDAEAERRFDQTLTMINTLAAQARAAQAN